MTTYHAKKKKKIQATSEAQHIAWIRREHNHKQSLIFVYYCVCVLYGV